ncbi:hypothetical protein DFJ73DRAFT_811269, partial [Zopfochytrium polystomum]
MSQDSHDATPKGPLRPPELVTPLTLFFNPDVLSASCLQESIKAVAFSGAAGLAAGAGSGWWLHLPTDLVLRNTWKKGGVFAALGGLLYGSTCYAAQIRGKDDPINAGIAGAVTGLAVGMRGGTVTKMFFHSGVLGGVLLFSDWAVRRHKVTYRGIDAVREERDKGFFGWKRRDPYAERWAEIKEHDAAAGA